VTLVPEIDTPGHSAALVRMHPELDTGRNVRIVELMPGRPRVTAWLDPDEPKALELVAEVLTHVGDVFSGPYFHVGGDEPNDMPPELYARSVRRIREHVTRAGRRSVGWQEIARAGLDADDVIHWIDPPEPTSGRRLRAPAASLPPDVDRAVREANHRASEDVRRAIAASARLLLSPTSHAYLDVPCAEPSSDLDQEPIRRRLGMPFLSPSTVEEFHGWDPTSTLPGARIGRDVAGVSAALWCETVRDFDDAMFLLLPRLPGIAERAWLGWSGATWPEYRSRLAYHGGLWDALDLRWFGSSVVEWVER